MTKNLAASVRDRLMKKAHATKRPFLEVLQYFAMERFLYRLAESPHADKFVLKGALLFTAWGAPASRPTRDIDLLAAMDNTVAAVSEVIRAVCRQPVADDGLVFDHASVEGTTIKEDADYSGVRVTFRVHLQTARVPMQIDLGFGDVVTPTATLTEYPILLDFAPPKLLGYPRETVVAEKFEAMTKLGLFNSRMKDFYDLWLLARQFDFHGPTLAHALHRTFQNRHTDLVAEPTALTPIFASDPSKQAQWQAFLRKSKLDGISSSLAVVVQELKRFLSPIAQAHIERTEFTQAWVAPGPWQAL